MREIFESMSGDNAFLEIEEANELEIGKEGEQLADEQSLLTPRDVFVFFQLYKEDRREQGNPPNHRLSTFYEKEIWKKKRISEKELLASLFHLSDKHIISFEPPPGILVSSQAFFSLNLWGFSRMNVPADGEAMSDSDIEKLMYRNMLRARRRIEGWKRIEKTVNRMQEIEKDLKRSQEEVLRNMVAIFAIFVSIFSFILVGSASALSVQPKSLFDLFIVVLTIFIPILILLALTHWWFARR